MGKYLDEERVTSLDQARSWFLRHHEGGVWGKKNCGNSTIERKLFSYPEAEKFFDEGQDDQAEHLRVRVPDAA
jgi:hypothetical protein